LRWTPKPGGDIAQGGRGLCGKCFRERIAEGRPRRGECHELQRGGSSQGGNPSRETPKEKGDMEDGPGGPKERGLVQNNKRRAGRRRAPQKKKAKKKEVSERGRGGEFGTY